MTTDSQFQPDTATAERHVVVVGGGAAGFFAAITAAESDPTLRVTILERAGRFLQKVRISGGGRCNVTHADFDARAFTRRYPRGDRALIGPFHRFQARDTVAWFAARGVELKTEGDGRMFPTTDSSETVIACLVDAARAAGVTLRTDAGVESARRLDASGAGGFELTLLDGERLTCDVLVLTTGGCRTIAAGELPQSLGHTLEPPVPSLFTLHLDAPWLLELPGVSVEAAEVSVPGTKLRERGPLLITHWGVSGPVVLRLSAWGARVLHDVDYRSPLHINWLPQREPAEVAAELEGRAGEFGAKLVVNVAIAPLPSRLWKALVAAAGIDAETRWSGLSRVARLALRDQLCRTVVPIVGKSLNKDEFVTCGGVRLDEVSFKTMESRRCPGLYLAGELLDIDGITGGFNFQSAWTTGWLAGQAIAAR